MCCFTRLLWRLFSIVNNKINTEAISRGGRSRSFVNAEDRQVCSESGLVRAS